MTGSAKQIQTRNDGYSSLRSSQRQGITVNLLSFELTQENKCRRYPPCAQAPKRPVYPSSSPTRASATAASSSSGISIRCRRTTRAAEACMDSSAPGSPRVRSPRTGCRASLTPPAWQNAPRATIRKRPCRARSARRKPKPPPRRHKCSGGPRWQHRFASPGSAPRMACAVR